MKYIYIFSDTHGNINGCIDVINNAERVDAIIHAGDYTRDADDLRSIFPSIQMYCVKGNGDFSSNEAIDLVTVIDGIRIFITHGHMYDVKHELGYRTLKRRGKEAEADIVVFGHTHSPDVRYEGDMTLVNPGSSGYGDTYAVIKIDEKKVTVNIYTM